MPHNHFCLMFRQVNSISRPISIKTNGSWNALFSKKPFNYPRFEKTRGRNRHFYLSLVLSFANSLSLSLRKENPNSAAHRKLYYCDKFRCPKCRQSKSARSRAFTFSTSTLRRDYFYSSVKTTFDAQQCARTERARE